MAQRIIDSRWSRILLLVAVFCSLIVPGAAVKHENFKTCQQSGFCKRNRELADSALSSKSTSPYRLDPASIKVKDGSLTGVVLKSIDSSGTTTVELPIIISFLKSGVTRVEIDEAKRQKGDIEIRHESKARKERYNEAAKWSIVGGLEAGSSKATKHDDKTDIAFGPDQSYRAVVHHNPFSIDFIRDEKIQVQLNAQGLLNFEHWRPKVEKVVEEPKEGQAVMAEAPADEGEDESTWWEESFGGNTDSKPRGPESIGLDITFPEYEHVFGIPSHTGPLSLKETRGGSGNFEEPYRLYNSDVFEYIMDSPMTLYGSIPLMQAHRKDSTVGVLWMNSAELWVDIVKTVPSNNKNALGLGGKKDTRTHWFSESGVMDIFVFLGPTPKDLIADYAVLTGTQILPPQFSIASHQCRWNYVTDEDVKDVDRKFDKHGIPYDVIWLDIEYTDGKKYFTWDPLQFKEPLEMQKQLDDHERKLVVIIDPHIKNEGGYHVVDQLKEKGLAVRDKSGNHYDGWCWPGSSHWVDCFNPAARKWWESLFAYSSFTGTAKNTHLWNDMNEPSVFNGPETTMPKDNLFYEDWEHRDVHNLNGMTFHNATYEALVARDKGTQRPFVLTRAFFAGSQRSAAMWTGDNQADWEHLAASLPMILSQNIAGFPFAGADVGGFFGNPSKELLTRWYQTGIFYPFMRAHAHIDTRRREPYLAGEPYTGIIAQAVRLRYALLPAWYTAFHESSVTGAPIVRPMYYTNPEDEKGFTIDDQLFLGDTGLLAKPVTKEGATSVDIYLPDEETYYDYFDFTAVSGAGKTHTRPAPLDRIPLLMQGGHIIPRKDRPRRSSGLMRWDPYTLVIVLDRAGNAKGDLYFDDGATFEYRDGAYVHRRFTFESATNTLVSEDVAEQGKKTKAFARSVASIVVEKIVVVGAPKAWKDLKQVAVNKGPENALADLQYHPAEGQKAAWAVVRNPAVSVSGDWSIEFASA